MQQQQQQNISGLFGDLTARMQPTKRLFFALGYLGASFSILFTGFNVAQSFITTIFEGSFGFVVLFIVYIVFGISALFAPLLTNSRLMARLSGNRNEHLAMMLGSFGLLLFVITIALRIQLLVIFGSVLCGLSSGLLWISQGVWVTKSVNHFTISEKATSSADGNSGGTKDTKIVGTATSAFFIMFNINGILGNIISVSFLNSGSQSAFNTLLWIMVGMIAVGCLMLSQSPQIFPLYDSTEALPIQSQRGVDGDKNQSVTILKSNDISTDTDDNLNPFRQLWRLITTKQALFLTPYLVCQGINISFTFGNFPKYITYGSKHLTDPEITEENQIAIRISTALLVYGVGSIIGSFLWGRVYDYANSRLYPLLGSHFFLVTLSVSILMAYILHPLNNAFPIIVFIGFIYGLNDFLTNAIINNSIAKLFKGKDVARMFSWYRFCFCFGFAVNSALSSISPRLEAYANPEINIGWARYGWLINIVLVVVSMLVSVFSGHILESTIGKSVSSQFDDVAVLYTSEESLV